MIRHWVSFNIKLVQSFHSFFLLSLGKKTSFLKKKKAANVKERESRSKLKAGILHVLKKPVNIPLVFFFGAAFSFWLESNFFGGWLGIGIVSNLLERSRDQL